MKIENIAVTMHHGDGTSTEIDTKAVVLEALNAFKEMLFQDPTPSQENQTKTQLVFAAIDDINTKS